jgi:hypothetical protein
MPRDVEIFVACSYVNMEDIIEILETKKRNKNG